MNWGSFDKSAMGTNAQTLPEKLSIENGLGRGKISMEGKLDFMLNNILKQ